MIIYVRVVQIKRPISGESMGYRFIAGTESQVNLTNMLTWNGDHLDPGYNEMESFNKLLRDFPYHADEIVWKI